MLMKFLRKSRENSRKMLENLGKILREPTNLLDSFRSKYQNILRKTEETFLILCRYSYFEKILLNVRKNLFTLWEYFEGNWKIFRLTCFVKILRNYKKYFEEMFGNLEKMIMADLYKIFVKFLVNLVKILRN